MSAYPPPVPPGTEAETDNPTTSIAVTIPVTTPAPIPGTSPVATTATTDTHSPSNQHQQQPANIVQYDGLTSSTPATTIAHHSLQALQAASAAAAAGAVHAQSQSPESLAQQYAQTAAMHVGDPQFGLSLSPQSGPSPGIAGTVANGAGVSNTSSQKMQRLRRACDMCSQRKVKCDESGPPCKPCRDLGVECTFHRTMKRRGPPNKHAEAAKAAKRAREENAANSFNEEDSSIIMASTLQDAAAAAAAAVSEKPMLLIAGHNVPLPLTAESIVPMPILKLLVDDFFTYIHPLIPFPHEPTFRQAFDNREDCTSREFLALVASMIGVLVASFPRSARAHLKAEHSTEQFPTAFSLIDRCRIIALEARGAQFMNKEEMTVDDAAASYFLGLACAYTLQWIPCRRFLSESLTFCKEVDFQRATSNAAAGLDASAPQAVDHIKDQISKRIFWVVLAGVRSMTQIGLSVKELPIPPRTIEEPYPDLPVEVDDEYIFADQILTQPQDTLSSIAGFNRNAEVYETMDGIVGTEMCYGVNFLTWSGQMDLISGGLSRVKSVVANLPEELKLKVDSAQPNALPDDDSLQYYPPADPPSQLPDDVRLAIAEQPLRRRQLQFEVQKANIYASQLATRSYYVERYFALRDIRRAQPDFAESDAKEFDEKLSEEREQIVQDLLTMISSISQRNLEPNGGSLIHKIRQVASVLVNDVPERKGPLATKADEPLNRFVDILMKLEKIGGNTASGTMTSLDEEEELQNWASLRELQIQFAERGGFLANV